MTKAEGKKKNMRTTLRLYEVLYHNKLMSLNLVTISSTLIFTSKAVVDEKTWAGYLKTFIQCFGTIS